ncbi:MAG: sigma-E factor negative regulatory protein [Spongiibacteraceae bacterium]
MSDQLRESVSALMDGEADELELRRLLSRQDMDSTNRVWSRFHLARDVMQDQYHSVAFKHLDISAQVSEAIKQERPPTQKSIAPQWWRPAAGFAVAASVAAALVFSVQPTGLLEQGQSQSVVAAAEVTANNELAVNTPVPQSGRVYPVQGASLQASGGGGAVIYSAPLLPGRVAESQDLANKEARARLDKYLLRHTERAVRANGQGMIPFARVASFEVE